MVGDDPVQLLRHRPVAAPQPGLEVSHLHAALRGDERCGDGGVHVAGHEHPVDARQLGERALEGDHHPRGLLGVGARADAEVHVRLAQPEVLEEDLGHARVVVLAGVDEALIGAARGERAHHRRDLHEVGACADDVDDERHPAS